ncbi:Site-specific DNA recombinase [Geodermatophilus obscurus]|uniref:Site-specific DNA recombinase n=1 Tax=Geodermatophilus obscurus TaxID=1861 RepID=A0A1I5GMJ4_9ACTN|nr:recombinase family protein [Geodermatophilus obscurus]SFO37139.1 Site-specific DNA recombinase [Geodermatophilus obscurus]
MRRRAVLYSRISKDREGAGLGVDRQRQDCAELAERLGWGVVAHHSDNDLSAYSGRPRPGYHALLDDLRRGRADAVVVWHTDRLHRRPVELEEYIDVCDPRGVITQTVKAGPLDLATPSGRMVARMLGSAGRYEVEHMIERQQAAKLQAATAGRWKGGRRPFGYEPDGVALREAEAEEIQRATDDLLAGMSLHAIARDWNARGVTTSTGGQWKATEVRKLLTRPRNAGLMEHRGEVVGKAQWPAIVDESLWQAARALMSDPSRRTTTGNARRWLGGGLYRCGVCGATLRATTGGTGGLGRGSVAAYRCEQGAHVVRRCAQLDAFVEALAVERLSQPDAADLSAPDSADDTSAVHAERLAVQARLDELIDRFAVGQVTGQQLQRGTATLRGQLDALDARLAAAGVSALAGIAGPSAADVWPPLDLSRRRAIIDVLMTVTVHRARRGRPPGWRPGESYFDPRGIEITWKAG